MGGRTSRACRERRLPTFKYDDCTALAVVVKGQTAKAVPDRGPRRGDEVRSELPAGVLVWGLAIGELRSSSEVLERPTGVGPRPTGGVGHVGRQGVSSGRPLIRTTRAHGRLLWEGEAKGEISIAQGGPFSNLVFLTGGEGRK